MRIGTFVDFRINRTELMIDLLVIPVLLVAAWKNFIIQYTITFGFILCHELGHIAIAKKQGARLHSIRIMPIGVNAAIDDLECNKVQKIMIYLAGPLVNLIFAVISYCICMWKSTPVGLFNDKIMLAISINLWLAIFNLIPIPPLDGGKVLMELLTRRIGLFSANRFINIISVIFSFVIIGIGMVVLIKSRYNASFIFIGVYILFLLNKNKKEAAILNIKSFVFKRSAIIRKGICPVREIAVMNDVKLLEVVKSMDYADVFHKINVLDNDLNIIKVITEQDVLNAFMEGSQDMTIAELLTKNVII